MESFFIDRGDISDGVARVRGEEFHHLSRVMRKRVGEMIYLFDGSGWLYTAQVKKIQKGYAECEIIKEEFFKDELNVDIILAHALLRNRDRFEFAIEKATELGVRVIVPLFTERVISRSSKVERWRRVILSACKQSIRAIIPDIWQPVEFDEFVQIASSYQHKILFHEKATDLFINYLEDAGGINSIVLAVGPEGGFTDYEVKVAVEGGFDVLSLGHRRLRSETAGISAVSILSQYLISKQESKR